MVAGYDEKRTGDAVIIVTVRLVVTVLSVTVNHSRLGDRFPCDDV